MTRTFIFLMIPIFFPSLKYIFICVPYLFVLFCFINIKYFWVNVCLLEKKTINY